MHKILIVDDDRNQREMLGKILALEGMETRLAASAREALDLLAQAPSDFMISDLRMPDMTGLELFRQVKKDFPHLPVVIITAFGTVDNAVAAVKEGVYDYVTKPVDTERLLKLIERALKTKALEEENNSLKKELKQVKERRMIGNSPRLRAALEEAVMVAASDATVMIYGESGTGKELLAEAIHQASARRDAPLVKINCAAIPETLIESELFGHQKGAFTGALRDHRGKFESAHSGSIFLDEIGDLPSTVQVKLLRVLQERRFEAVGSNKTIEVDIRVIAATHRNLAEAVAQGVFREDLYYRLNVVSITMPPLRERGEDVLLLAEHFLENFSAKYQKPRPKLSLEAMELLRRYPWPGNVRELENCMERAVVMGRGAEIQAAELPLRPPAEKQSPEVLDQLLAEEFSMDEWERRLIEKALTKCGGNQVQAAKLLGISRRTLQYRAEKYKLL